jgi:hypothetical protein
MHPLDGYIRQNLEQFDTEDPLHGHFDRFDAKLAQLEKRNDSRILTTMLRIAAVILLGLVITYSAIREVRLLNRSNENIISETTYPELNEVEQFYTSQLNLYYTKIQQLRFNNDQIEKKQVIDELSEMDQQVWAMKLDLRQNPDDERIVYAIINFYQMKMELMDMIIARTQQSTNTML